MTVGMIVRIPVTVAFGTDEEFDLRVRLERDLGLALITVGVGECAGGEIDSSHLLLHVAKVADPVSALSVTQDVLARAGLLTRSEIVLETRSKADPDEPIWQVLWPAAQPPVARSA